MGPVQRESGEEKEEKSEDGATKAEAGKLHIRYQYPKTNIKRWTRTRASTPFIVSFRKWMCRKRQTTIPETLRYTIVAYMCTIRFCGSILYFFWHCLNCVASMESVDNKTRIFFACRYLELEHRKILRPLWMKLWNRHLASKRSGRPHQFFFLLLNGSVPRVTWFEMLGLFCDKQCC